MTEEMIEYRKMLMVLSRHLEEDYYKTGALHIKIAAAMEEYAQDKVKNLGLFDVSNQRERFITFLQWFFDNETKIEGDPETENFVDAYLKSNE